MYADTIAPNGGTHRQPAPQPAAPVAPPLDPHGDRQRPGRATGPRTAEGKARSSKNALKHGLTSEDVVLAEEDAGDFEDLRQGFIEERRPVGETEETLVEIIAVATWRLRRVWRMEPVVYDAIRAKVNRDVAAGAAWYLDCMGDAALDKLGRHEAKVFRALMQSEARLRLIQKLRAAGVERPYPANGKQAGRLREAQAATVKGSTGGNSGNSAKRTPRREWVKLEEGELEPRISRMEPDELEKRQTAGEPQIVQIGTDEQRDAGSTQFNLRSSAKSAVPNPLSHDAEPAPQSEILQNELPPALSAEEARALLDAVQVEPLPPHPVHGTAVRDELTLLVRGADGQLRELARRVVSGAGRQAPANLPAAGAPGTVDSGRDIPVW
jgi:hypothetical protein